MKEIIIATKNAGKAKEFEHIFKPYNVCVKSLLDFEAIDEVHALYGRPVVYSARYAGEGRNDHENILKVLRELEGVSDNDRSARFVCALAIVAPNQEEVVVRGTCEGQILTECLGTEGFGYDPIFYLPQLSKTMAQLPKSEKNVLSHRADAFVKLQPYLEKLL